MKQYRIGNKDYIIKYTVANMKLFQGATQQELESGDITKMLCHTSEMFYLGLKGLDRKMTPMKADEIMEEYIEEGGSLTDLLEELTEEYLKSLGITEGVDDKKNEI